MKILQLTSDWKWTGPAEPMLRLALALRERGHEVSLACPEPQDASGRSLAGEARSSGLAPSFEVSRDRGGRWLSGRQEVARLRDFLDAHSIEIVHAWHTWDHLLALRASRMRRKRGLTRVVRSYRSAEKIPGTPWNRWLFGPGTDGLLCVSPETAQCNAGLRAGRPSVGVFGAVEHESFFPKPRDPEVMESLGLHSEDQVVGIVARVQPHRRFDLLLDASEILFRRNSRARVLVVGRGTRRKILLEDPVRERGLEDRVLLAGYRDQDFAEVLRCIDVFTFLVPGSDGSCRAVLEAAACGIPAVTTARGALPEIVLHSKTGIIAQETPEDLASAWQRILQDAAYRERMGRAAHARAKALFTPQGYAEKVEALYDSLAFTNASR